jgi:hypothetical protein
MSKNIQKVRLYIEPGLLCVSLGLRELHEIRELLLDFEPLDDLLERL